MEVPGVYPGRHHSTYWKHLLNKREASFDNPENTIQRSGRQRSTQREGVINKLEVAFKQLGSATQQAVGLIQQSWNCCATNWKHWLTYIRNTVYIPVITFKPGTSHCKHSRKILQRGDTGCVKSSIMM